MPYSVWKNGEKIGETRFELNPGPRKRAGVFHPTVFGLTVLPGITAMMPALFDFGRMCKERGVDVEDDRPEAAEHAFDSFANTPEGKRLQAAASCVAELELRDAAGDTMEWESIMISDMTKLAEIVERHASGRANQLKMLPGDPIRFMITTTLVEHPTARQTNVLGAGEPIGVC